MVTSAQATAITTPKKQPPAWLRKLKTTLIRERTVVISIPYLWLLIFFLIPFLIILYTSFRELSIDEVHLNPLFNFSDIDTAELKLKLSSYMQLFTDGYYWTSYLVSLKYAAITTFLCLILGYPFAYFLTRSSKKAQLAMLMAVMVPFWTSFLLRVYAWRGLLDSHSGWIGKIIHDLGLDSFLIKMGLISVEGMYYQSPMSLVLGMVYTYLPFMILPLYGTLSKLDTRLLEASQDLGATPWQTFWKVTIPLTKPGIIAGSMLVFIPCVGEYVIPTLLGDPKTLMIGNILYMEFAKNNDWPMASALAVIMVIFIIIPISIFNHVVSKGEQR